jgi:hypothetical protein
MQYTLGDDGGDVAAQTAHSLMGCRQIVPNVYIACRNLRTTVVGTPG